MRKSFSTALFLFFIALNLISQGRPKVVVSASMIFDIAQNIGGDNFDLDMIVPIGGDPHIHDPTPGDAHKVNKADLVLINGLSFEGWMNELIENSGYKGQTVVVTEGLEPLRSLAYQNSTDPHAWMDVSNVIIYAGNIRDAFSELLPDKTEVFLQNYNRYKAELKKLDSYITTKILSIPADKRILVTSHDAFQYYGKKYGLKLEAIMGISTDAEAQTSDIMRVNRVIREFEVPAVFIESTINPKLISQIAKDNNVVIGGQLYADSLGDNESPANTYINMLKSNTDTIVSALLGDKQETTDKEGGNLIVFLVIGIVLIIAMFLGVRQLNN
jgi:ABC-type Zn uptake system ZnuABC Zn-binding protein ZnuA